MIPGGNDSFGTGISAGGAQVMGQSAGLNDLVKLGMARQKQRQQRLPNVPTQNIDTSQLKMPDVPEIIQGVQTYRDKSMQANLENNPQARYELLTQANNALAQVQQKIDISKNSQAKLQSFRSNIANPNFDHTQDDDYNKGLSDYETSKSGSAEEKAAELRLPLTHYTKVDVPGIEKALNNEVYKSAQMDINQNAPGAVKDMHYNEKRVASGQSMMATLNNFSMSNKATDNMFISQGKDLLSNPGNDQHLQNLKSKYNIDLEDPSQVGQANYIDHKVEGLKQFNINKRSQLYPGKGLSINLGEQEQPDALPLNNAPEYIKAHQTGENGAAGIVQTLKYDKNASGLSETNLPNGNYYNPKTNGMEIHNSLTNVHGVGGATSIWQFKPGVQFTKDVNGNSVNRDANEGAVSDHMIKQSETDPGLRNNIIQNQYYHIQGYDPNTKKNVELFAPRKVMPQAAFGVSGKSVKANISRQEGADLKATNAIDNASTKNKYIDVQNGSKKVKGF